MSVKKTKDKVLSDHKKIGKNLVPPYVFLLGEGKDVEWRQRIIPEYLWLGLLNFKIGWVEGADISLTLARIASQAVGVPFEEFEKQYGKAPKQFFALTSAYKTLETAQLNKIVEELKTQNKLNTLKLGLRNLISLYPECPLNFLFEKKPISSDEDLPILQELVSVLFVGEHNLTVAALTNAVYIAFCTNKLRVIVSDNRDSPTDPNLMHFPEIERYPNTELSKQVAASVRMQAGLLVHNDDENTEQLSINWCDYFWNRGLEITKCIPPSFDKLYKTDENK